MTSIVKDEPPPLQTSPSLEKIIRRCLPKQPSGRYQRITEVKTALEQACEEKAPGSFGESQPSIAVLPFANISGDKEQEYFSDGLAEEIINSLAQIPGLKVIARTSAFGFKGQNIDVRRIAEALGVANILEGSVRKSGNRIRVTAHLITAADGSHLWSQRYDREMVEVFAVQDEIAAAIAEALKIKLGAEPAAAPRRYNPKLPAYEAYLKARYHWGKLRPESMARCKQYLEEAIALDPEFALAHCGYADHLLKLANAGYVPAHEVMPRVREEARKALEIDPSVPDAHAMLGLVASVYDYDWNEAERRFRLALAHEPVPPRVHQWYSWCLLASGRPAESLELAEQGLKEGPLRVTTHLHSALSLFSVGRLADAQVELHKILELEENQPWASYILVFTYARQDNWAEALYFAEKATPMIPVAIGTLAGVLMHKGEVKRAEELIEKLMPGETYGAPIGLCIFCLMCGDIDRAADWLEKAIEQRDPLCGLSLSLHFSSSSRWPALARLMNLPEEVR